MLPAQAIAHLRQQGVVRYQRQIVHIHTMGKSLSTGSAYADENDFIPDGPCCHCGLGFHLITRINDSEMLAIRFYVVKENMRPVFLIDKILYAVHLAARIDMLDAFAHRLHLGFSKRAIECMNLTIDVRFSNVVKVNQGKTCHAAARCGLGRP